MKKANQVFVMSCAICMTCVAVASLILNYVLYTARCADQEEYQIEIQKAGRKTLHEKKAPRVTASFSGEVENYSDELAERDEYIAQLQDQISKLQDECKVAEDALNRQHGERRREREEREREENPERYEERRRRIEQANREMSERIANQVEFVKSFNAFDLTSQQREVLTNYQNLLEERQQIFNSFLEDENAEIGWRRTGQIMRELGDMHEQVRNIMLEQIGVGQYIEQINQVMDATFGMGFGRGPRR